MADFDTFDFLFVMNYNYRYNYLFLVKHLVEFYRTDTEAMTLEGVSDDVFKSLKGEESVLICEINPKDGENPEEAEIVYAYEAEIAE